MKRSKLAIFSFVLAIIIIFSSFISLFSFELIGPGYDGYIILIIFLFALLGLTTSIMSLVYINKKKLEGKWMAKSALIILIFFFILTFFYILIGSMIGAFGLL